LFNQNFSSQAKLCLVSSIPLPFRRSFVPLPFCRSVAAVARKNGIAETYFRIHTDEETTMLIGCPPTAERQKIGRNGRWQRQRHNGIFYVGNIILMALTEFA